ncbi:MAG: sulfur oxidation c-type cytochrome SoxX [Pseudomonadales bacterium]|jgi:sulfur-oxidizing protein SoxX|nr:sulfur oxidation c-type cytochrome SoxX [Pseudomonadales bacterium]
MPSVDLRALAALLLCIAASTGSADCAPLVWRGQLLPDPLGGARGDPSRGAAVAGDRNRGDCTICHLMPLPEREFHGTVGPALDSVGDRLTVPELRARIAAPRRFVPETVMPEYCTTGGRHRVDPAYAGQPILSAGEIEDLVAWLATLRAPPAP